MTIFLDNNATTRIHPRVLETLSSALESTWGNPSSVHYTGRKARQSLEEARARVAELLEGEPSEIIFTSGGTESNNAAIFGRALLDESDRFHIVTTSIEHPSVRSVIQDLERRGWPVTRVDPQSDGVVRAEDVAAAIRPDTRLVAMMLANNETGVIQPVAAVARTCRERNVHIHCDAVQAIGKIPVDVGALGVDSVSLSGHKFHGPKGIGALWLRKGVTLHPYILGGSQERRRRAGTENAPLASALAVASELAKEGLARMDGVAAIRDEMERGLAEGFEGAVVRGATAERLPNTSSVTFSSCDSESLIIGLDIEGFAVSAGSACSSGRVEASHVLTAMGLSESDAKSTIRISLCQFTTREEISSFVEAAARLAGSTRESRIGT